MKHLQRRMFWIIGCIFLSSASLSAPLSASNTASTTTTVYLPFVAITPGAPSPFGFDVRLYYDDRILSYAREANPRWVRAGDILWSHVEQTRGVYDWTSVASLDANVLRLRQLGFEPMVVIQQSPAWAQREPGRLCSPPKPEYLDDFARFAGAVAARYASGPTAIHFYEIWNEPDYTSQEAPSDLSGFGCWLDGGLPYYGGAHYGEAVKRTATTIKANNPQAAVLAGAFSFEPGRDNQTLTFMRGMLTTGAGNYFDFLSFHAYGEWGAGDLLIPKTRKLRGVLAEFGLSKPLFATEIGASCNTLRTQGQQPMAECPADFELRQANYAARIYAETIAQELSGALWFSLVAAGPTIFSNAQLIDDQNGTFVPRPSFYSFRNSARLLAGSRYIGPPRVEPAPNEVGEVQILKFQKGFRTMYVLWVPVADFPKIYNLQVPPGSLAVCTDQINRDIPATYYCSDLNGDGIIPRAVNELPQYVELIHQ
jgi:hypothetical protein